MTVDRRPTIVIESNFHRPGDDDLSIFSEAGASAVSDALGKKGSFGNVVKPMTGNKQCVGRALTMVCSPNDNLVPYVALKHIHSNDIVVIATGGQRASAALLGGTIIGYLRNIGVAGVVTDALIRDIAEIDGIGIPVFATGLSTAAPGKADGGAIGMPIAIAGVIVQSGDIIVADEDGVTVVPANQEADVRSKIPMILKHEGSMKSCVDNGDLLPAWLQVNELETHAECRQLQNVNSAPRVRTK